MSVVMKALVVDDSSSMRTIVSGILNRLGVDQVVQAENGRDAMRVLASGSVPDLALVDWHMPVMNGLELVRAIRARPLWCSMAITMMTIENEHDDIVRALAAGATSYLVKPFTANALAAKMSLMGFNPLLAVPA
jgi:two-component system, chemotaxis family, chemotaxis protein CheY